MLARARSMSLSSDRMNSVGVDDDNGDAMLARARTTSSDGLSPICADENKKKGCDGVIRIGKHYQAVIPSFEPDKAETIHRVADRALLVWKPAEGLRDEHIDEYLKVATEKYKYTKEQAFGILYWNNHDIKAALRDLMNFSPQPDEEWTVEDKAYLDQLIQHYGKNFARINKKLRRVSIGAVVTYYYKTKKPKPRLIATENGKTNLASGSQLSAINEV